MEVESMKLLAAALALLPITGAALALGKIFSAYYDATGRNPTAVKEMNKFILISAAMAEALGIFALLVSLLILFVV